MVLAATALAWTAIAEWWTGDVGRETVVEHQSVWPRADTPPRLLSVGMSDADYPRAAIRRGEHGTSQLHLLISVQGHVAKCEISRTSGSQILDRAACAGIRSASFAPGRAADGSAEASSVTVPIVWRLPT